MSAVALDRDRFAKLLGMLSSRHDGEALAAARQAERLRADAGLTWPEILVPRLSAPQTKPKPEDQIADAIRFSLRHSEVMTEWEEEFLNSIAGQEFPLSEKQFAVLDRLFKKAQRAAAGAA